MCMCKSRSEIEWCHFYRTCTNSRTYIRTPTHTIQSTHIVDIGLILMIERIHKMWLNEQMDGEKPQQSKMHTMAWHCIASYREAKKSHNKRISGICMNVFKLTLIHPSTTRFDTIHTALHCTAQHSIALMFVDAQAYRWKSQMNELLNTHNAMQNAWIYLLCSIWYSKLKCAFIIIYGMCSCTHTHIYGKCSRGPIQLIF